MITLRPTPTPVLLAILGTALASIPLTGQDAAGPEPGIAVDRLTDDVYLMRAPSEMDRWTSSNSVVVVGETGVLVFDSNALPSTTRRVLAEIRTITDLPVRVLVNSHWHMDHWSGNEIYADTFPGLSIVSTARTRAFMKRMPNPYFVNSVGLDAARQRLASATTSGRLGDGTAATDEGLARLREDVEAREALDSEIRLVRRVLPTTVYADSMTLSLDGREIRLYSMTGDAAGSTVMYLPGERLLVTGDVLARQEDGRGAQPWTMNSFAVSEWRESLRRLEGFDASIIVPGQGPALQDKAYLSTTRALYDSLIEQTGAALERGAVGLADVRASVDVSRFHDAFALDAPDLVASFDAVVLSLVRRIVQEMHDGVAPPS